MLAGPRAQPQKEVGAWVAVAERTGGEPEASSTTSVGASASNPEGAFTWHKFLSLDMLLLSVSVLLIAAAATACPPIEIGSRGVVSST